MALLQDFRNFAVRGNAVDLAVGVIIGAAFGRIVDSIVKDIVMPMFNAVFGGLVNFENKYWVLSGNVAPGASLAEAQKMGVVLAWGSFLTILINFVILAFVIFWMVRLVTRVRERIEAPPAPPPPAGPPEDIVLLREIRDSLKKTSAA
ncbi:MAG TPA: large conductance mechanosensitive channel protein MscL [Burkholderiaceae bacterium]|nr:large conductance mechanosensitive channel protein MscL [Burkholderiaceae bacterium]